MIKKRLILVTDIPTPYRVHFFEALNRELMCKDIAFEVLFMAMTSPRRFWEFDTGRWTFPYKVTPGFHFRFSGNPLFLNPGIIWSILRKPPRWLIIGGGWSHPSAFLLMFACSIFNLESYTILWSEANYAYMMHKTGPMAAFRQAVARCVDAFAVPGQIAKETIEDYWGIDDKPFLPLPNLIDEEAYGKKVAALRTKRKDVRHLRGLKDDDLVLLWPARLHESTKGILNFLKVVAPLAPRHVRILIAGEGPDRKKIENWLRASAFKGVCLLGHQSEEDMLELYAIADVLLLPSLRDSNPLSVIEGLWSGLPLFISDRCGNWPEAVKHRENGWVIDPSSKSSIQTAFMDLINLSSEELLDFGRISMNVAQQRFSTRRCTSAFVDAVLSLR